MKNVSGFHPLSYLNKPIQMNCFQVSRIGSYGICGEGRYSTKEN